MSWTIHQYITIHSLHVDSLSNSSVLQVGSAGAIRSMSQLYNSGGFSSPAPELSTDNPLSFVPLPRPDHS
ncbi:spore gernimation protein [Paenibacillus sp. MY03]|uniref:spore germination protein GerPB n=1 Tax=Paenibacillus sp. MY03 TaxID=302980 RepID=UPI000B3CE0AF|nr:spore germination protein GerPB [Paenibacillus sp. MY03]OUS77492.1 spore gernimation protein [Paenibacillus sp. MY03]